MYLPLPLLTQGQDGLEGSEDGGGELQCVAAVVAPPSLGLEHAVVVRVEAIVRLARPPVGVAQPLLALGPGEYACSPIYIELQTKAQVRAFPVIVETSPNQTHPLAWRRWPRSSRRPRCSGES